jgi:YD repeat-containing protein
MSNPRHAIRYGAERPRWHHRSLDTVTYHYDAQGRPSKLTYPSGREAEYTYDDRQLLKTIKWEGAQVEDRSYNDAGMLTGVWTRAFVDETRTYNAGSQLTQINNTNVGSQTYTYDLNGNVTSETLSGNMANYSFSTIHAGGRLRMGTMPKIASCDSNAVASTRTFC